MANHSHSERASLYAEEAAQLRQELSKIRSDSALVVQALDTAMQLIDSMMTFWPLNHPMPPQVSEVRERLALAMDTIRRRMD